MSHYEAGESPEFVLQPIKFDLNDTDVQIPSDDEDQNMTKSIHSFTKSAWGQLKFNKHDYSNTSTNNETYLMNSNYSSNLKFEKPHDRTKYRKGVGLSWKYSLKPSCPNRLTYEPITLNSSQIKLDYDLTESGSKLKSSEQSSAAKENKGFHYQRFIKTIKNGLQKSVNQHKKGMSFPLPTSL